MKFKLEFDVPENQFSFKHGDSLIFIGSCFSDEMSHRAQRAGHHVLNNPFGVLFHPDAIYSVIESALEQSEAVAVYQRKDLFFAWDSAGKVWGKNEAELRERLLAKRSELYNALQNAKMLVITFGTAWGYVHKECGKVVGNCHKAPTALFEKQLTDTHAMIEKWSQLLQQLKDTHPQLEVVFTVSPVRHKKDGLIENNRSKARLIELVHALSEQKSHYFPSYEMVIDELRDYRFFKEDMVHPGENAVNYVWDRFESYLFSKETRAVNAEVLAIRQAEDHSSLYPESMDALMHQRATEERKQALSAAVPAITW